MSHRTRDLEPLTGVRHTIRELRYHEIARQGLAVVLILVYALAANPSALWVAIGMPIALVGMLVRLYASGFIMKNEALATSGPYAFVRHPLYTGNILLLIGFSVGSGTWWAVPTALLFFWFYYPPAIEYEDRKLRRIFGERWDAWAAGVPALIPRIRSLGGTIGGEWSPAKSMRRNGELFFVIYVLVCMYLVVAPVMPMES